MNKRVSQNSPRPLAGEGQGVRAGDFETASREHSPLPTHHSPLPTPFGANAVRLSPREWFVAAVLVALVLYFVPVLWQRIEPFEVGPDYRIAYSLGNDYWMYDRSCRMLCADRATVVLGDSVVWGHYVAKDQTLSHYLTQRLPDGRFVNLGVDGIHPAAMEGLVRYYGSAIRGKKVLLQCNPLWISSPRHDLSVEKEFSFNHPSLVPQFYPRIPCYKETVSARLAIVVDRRIPFASWANHLKIAYLDNMDLYGWTYEHPYTDPVAAVTLKLPQAGEPPSPPPVARPWTEQKMSRFDASWVELSTSFQWRCFRETLDLLASRGNQVFVLVGPMNEHMLTEKSLAIYTARKGEIETWLAQHSVPHCVATVLPSELYADASHPLAEGYARLAEQLAQGESFRRFLAQSEE